MYKAHRGSDLEKMSMSMRFSQEMVSSTLEAKWVDPTTGGAPEAMATSYIVNALQIHYGVGGACIVTETNTIVVQLYNLQDIMKTDSASGLS